jgi:hypothetical protein
MDEANWETGDNIIKLDSKKRVCKGGVDSSGSRRRAIYQLCDKLQASQGFHSMDLSGSLP